MGRNLRALFLLIVLIQAQPGDSQADSSYVYKLYDFVSSHFLSVTCAITIILLCVLVPYVKLKCQEKMRIGNLREQYSKDIKEKLGNHHGLAIIVGMTVVNEDTSRGVYGANVDVKNMEEAFTDLKFAVLKYTNLFNEHLRALILAATSYKYPKKQCKVIAFYYAGHGGSANWDNAPYISTYDRKSLQVYKDIVSKFYPSAGSTIEAETKRIFFFDSCQGKKLDSGYRYSSLSCCRILKWIYQKFRSSFQSDGNKSNSRVPAQGNCLVAFAVSPSYVSRGDETNGGIWTRILKEKLTENANLATILVQVYESTVELSSEEKDCEERNVQGPTISICMGELNLTTISNAKIQVDSAKFQPLTSSGRSHPPGQTTDRAASSVSSTGTSSPVAGDSVSHIQVDSDGNEATSQHVQTTSQTSSQSSTGVLAPVADNDPKFPIKFKDIKPKLRDLVNWLDSIVYEWYNLGDRLGVKKSNLKSWRNSNRSDSDKLSDVLDSWYQSECSPYTYGHLWNVLVEMKETGEARTKMLQGLQRQYPN